MESTKPGTVARMSVRELIADLSEAEDGLRRARRTGPDRGRPGTESDVAALVRREQVIVRELRRRAHARRIEESRVRTGRR